MTNQEYNTLIKAIVMLLKAGKVDEVIEMLESELIK